MQERDLLEAQDRLLPVAERLQKVGAQDPSFSGVAIDASTNTVTVYRVGGGTGQTAAYLAVDRGGAAVAFHEAILSKAQVNQLTQRIGQDWPQLRSQGVRINRFGGDARGGPFQIGVEDAAQHRELLLARYGQYGPGTVEVIEEPPPDPLLGHRSYRQ